jgi:hypothetical protein
VSTTSPPIPPDSDLYDVAIRLVNAMLDSVDTAVVKPMTWWDRARTALETGASVSTTWPQCVARTARKLQIVTLTKASGETVVALGTSLHDPAVFAAWRALVVRDAIYIVAIARDVRDADKAARKAGRITADDIQPTPNGDTL